MLYSPRPSHITADARIYRCPPALFGGPPLFDQTLSSASPEYRANILNLKEQIQIIPSLLWPRKQLHRWRQSGLQSSAAPTKKMTRWWRWRSSSSPSSSSSDEDDEQDDLWKLLHQLVEAGVLPTKKRRTRHSHLVVRLWQDQRQSLSFCVIFFSGTSFHPLKYLTSSKKSSAVSCDLSPSFCSFLTREHVENNCNPLLLDAIARMTNKEY